MLIRDIKIIPTLASELKGEICLIKDINTNLKTVTINDFGYTEGTQFNSYILMGVYDSCQNGYSITYSRGMIKLYVWDMGVLILSKTYDDKGNLIDSFNLGLSKEELTKDKFIQKNPRLIEEAESVLTRHDYLEYDDLEDYFKSTLNKDFKTKAGLITWYKTRIEDYNTIPFESKRNFLRTYFNHIEKYNSVIKVTQELEFKYLGGIYTRYDELSNKLRVVFLIYDKHTQLLVDSAVIEEYMDLQYIPKLYKFNEKCTVIKAWDKLKIKPDLIFCYGHGISHPFRVGLATIIGIELGIPTIGCSESRMLGFYNRKELSNEKGQKTSLILDDEVIGMAVITKPNEKPIFISVGNKIGLDRAYELILEYSTNSKIPFLLNDAKKICLGFDIQVDSFDPISNVVEFNQT